MAQLPRPLLLNVWTLFACCLAAAPSLVALDDASSSDLEGRRHRSHHRSASSSESGLTGPTGPTGPDFVAASTSRYDTRTYATSVLAGALFPFAATFSPDEGFSYNAGALTVFNSGRYAISVGIASHGGPFAPINVVRTTAGGTASTLATISTTDDTSSPLIETAFNADLTAGDVISVVNASGSFINLSFSAPIVTLLEMHRIGN